MKLLSCFLNVVNGGPFWDKGVPLKLFFPIIQIKFCKLFFLLIFFQNISTINLMLSFLEI